MTQLMTRFIHSIAAFALGLSLALVPIVLAANQTFVIQPGDSADVSCGSSTTMATTQTSTSGVHLACAALPTPTPIPTATPVAGPAVWVVPQMTPLGQSVGYDPGTSPAAVMFQCGAWWAGQDDENTYAVVRFPKPTTISGVRFGSYAWNGTGVLGATGTMWLRDAGLLTEPGSDGRPLWHNNFRGDNDAAGGWSNDGIRANQIAPSFPNGAAGLTFDIPWGVTTYYTFTFPPVTVTDLRVELMDADGGGSFTTLIGGLHILTSATTPRAC